MRTLLLAGLLAGAALVAPAHAQVKKCIDASGKVVGYGSECPAGTRSQQTDIRNVPTPPAAPGAAKSVAEQEAEFRKRQIDKREAQEKADKLASEASARKANCEAARSYLKSLQSGMRITRSDPTTGERTVLGDADYPKEVAKTERAIQENCK